MISKFFIDRPIFAAVLSILIFSIGLASITVLPISQYPEITPPTVQINAAYPGANAETVAEALAGPIEQELAGAKDLLYFQSYSGNDGGLNITATFEVGSDIDIAAVEVQNRLKRAEPRLPQEAVRQGISITKSSTGLLMVISLKSEDPKYDALYLSNYATINMLDTIKRVPGIGDASVFGAQDYSMRIWVNPDLVASKGMTVSDIAQAIREQNGLYAAGRVGASPTAGPVELTVPVVTRGRLQTPEEFEKIVLRALPDGSFVYLKDVARVELSSQSFDLVGRQDGVPTTFILTYLQPDGNALKTTTQLRATMEELSKSFPAGVSYEVPYDITPFVEIAIEEVAKTFLEAMVLVSIVVMLFLGTWRATIIPLLAVPVAIIGAFAGILALGFSINSLTLFGLVLAIGIVVDDAIIVVENVERIMHDEGLPPRDATIKAMEQVTGPIIAIVLVLSAVFLPVGFLGGLTGELYKQFAVTIAVSVGLSGLVALTLSPALCVLLLKPNQQKFFVFRWFDSAFSWFTHGYAAVIRQTIRFGIITILIFGAMLWATAHLWQRLPSGFIPAEDQGYFITVVILPPGASTERTLAVMSQVEEFLVAQPEVEAVVSLAGIDFLAGGSQSSSTGIMFSRLKPWDDRKNADQHVEAMVGRVFGRFMGQKEGLVLAFNPPPVQGLGLRAGFELQVEDRKGGNVRELVAEVDKFKAELAKRPEIDVQSLQSTINVSLPQIKLQLDQERAKLQGVNITEVYDTLQALLGSFYVNDFVKFGRVYRVQIQADAPYRTSAEAARNFFVRNATGDMVPLSGLISTESQAGPNVVSRFNGFTSVQMTGSPAGGFSTGQAIAAVEEVAKKHLPAGYGYDWSGSSYQEIKAGGQAPYIIAFGLFVVFLVLAAQYERWSLPFAVLLGIPSGAFGALVAIWLMNFPRDIYFQIGLLTLIGLAAKNAILIVEFSSVLREQGMPIREAAVEAARVRLRPFIMTSMAFILGVMPLVLSTGAGAAGRNHIGTTVMGGMLAATFLDMFFVPLFFATMQWFSERWGGAPKSSAAPVATKTAH